MKSVVGKVALYRHFNHSDELLYVGISSTLPARLQQHQRNSSWFFDVRRIMIEWFDDRQSARLAEGKAIRLEHPKFNILKVMAEVQSSERKRAEDVKEVFMKIRVTKEEQAEWRNICRAFGMDFSAVIRDAMDEWAAALARKPMTERED